jgi:5-methyltetrahydrofolate--homocysteine methyltransferase
MMIPKDLLEHVEDVILDRRDDATERLLDFAERMLRTCKNMKNDFRMARERCRNDTHSLVRVDQLLKKMLRKPDKQRPIEVIEIN